MRKSGRPRCPPVEFWNFERPDYSVSHEVSYNLSFLGGLSKRGRNSTHQKKTKDFSNAPQKVHRDLSIVLNDIAKTITANTKIDHNLTPSKPRNNTKQVKTSTNAHSVSSRSFTRTHTNSVQAEKKSISPKVPFLPKNNSKNQSNRSNTRSKAVRNGTSREENKNVLESPKVHPGKFGLQEKQAPSNRGRKAQKCFSRMSEASDSGVTDLDISCGNTLINEARTNAKVAEISNINMVCQNFQDATEGPDDILSNLSRNNSYCRNRKPPNFKGVLSSTAVSEVDISKFNSSNSCSDGRGVIFKMPRYVPKIFMKKNMTIEPALDSIAEEKENEVVDNQSDATTYLTPKKTSTLIKSRHLNLEDLEEDGDDIETKDQSSKKQNEKDFSRNNQVPIDITSQNLTTQSDFESSRRSSRIRTKRLEFWNFEKAHVTTLNSGEVSVVYTKQEDPSETGRMSKRGGNPKLNPVTLPPDTNDKKDYSSIENKRKSEVPKKFSTEEGTKKTNTIARKRKSASSDKDESSCSTELSPRKRGKSYSTGVSPRKQGKNRSSDVSPTKRGRNQSFIVNSFLPTVGKVEFKSLMFYPWTEDDFTCYMARSYCNKEANIYAGFLFLQRGEMIWSTTKYTTFSVIEGEGALSVLDSDDDGTLVLLSANVKTVVPRGKKVRLEKEDSDELLKIFLVLQDKPY